MSFRRCVCEGYIFHLSDVSSQPASSMEPISKRLKIVEEVNNSEAKRLRCFLLTCTL